MVVAARFQGREGIPAEIGEETLKLGLEAEVNLIEELKKKGMKFITEADGLKVEEFRKVTFEVDVKAPVRHGRLGDKLAFAQIAPVISTATPKITDMWIET